MICKIGEKYLWLYVNIFVFVLYANNINSLHIIYFQFLNIYLKMRKLLFVAQVNIIGVMNGTEIALEKMKKAI